MKIIDIARELDNLFYEDDYTIHVSKVGDVSSILVKNNINSEIEFCKVGEVYAIKVNGEQQNITLNEFQNIFAPYLGRRLFVSL